MESLRETALLGTDKRALDLQQLPEPVKNMLRSAEAPDADWQFLEANSFYQFYEAAGRLPAKFTGTIDEQVIEEEKAVAPKPLMELFDRIESMEHQLRESAFALWLDLLIGQKFIVSPDRLVELLHIGKGASNETKAKIVLVAGRKGQWILENDASLPYAVAPTGDHLWLEGTTQERKNIFSALRQSDPKAAVDLLQSTWDTESIINKKSFLELLKQTVQPDDIPFLETLYGEFAFRPREKKTERECRRLVVSMLLRFETTKLYQQTGDHLNRYMTKAKKGIVGFVTGQASGAFRLPDEDDGFWNSKVMEEVYGLEPKSYDIALYSSARQSWLAHFLEYLPFTFWTGAFQSDYKKAVQFWLLDKTTIAGDSIPVFVQAMIDNAADHNDHELALALLQSRDPRTVLPLLKIMAPKDFEAFVLKNDYLDDLPLLTSGPFGADQYWSLPFSKAVLERAYKLSEKNQGSASFGKVIAQFAHHDSIGTLYELNQKAKDTLGYHHWNTTIFQLADPMLTIRNKIHTLKKLTP